MKKKLSVKALVSLFLSAVLFCMPIGAFMANSGNMVDVHAEDTGTEESSETSVEGSTETETATENTGETIYYIIPSFLRKYLKDAGYGSPLEKYTYMSEIGLISTTVEKSGKIRREVQKRFEKKTSWFIEFFYSRAVSDIPEKPSQTSLLQNSTGDLPF